MNVSQIPTDGKICTIITSVTSLPSQPSLPPPPIPSASLHCISKSSSSFQSIASEDEDSAFTLILLVFVPKDEFTALRMQGSHWLQCHRIRNLADNRQIWHKMHEIYNGLQIRALTRLSKLWWFSTLHRDNPSCRTSIQKQDQQMHKELAHETQFQAVLTTSANPMEPCTEVKSSQDPRSNIAKPINSASTKKRSTDHQSDSSSCACSVFLDLWFTYFLFLVISLSQLRRHSVQRPKRQRSRQHLSTFYISQPLTAYHWTEAHYVMCREMMLSWRCWHDKICIAAVQSWKTKMWKESISVTCLRFPFPESYLMSRSFH